MPLRSQYVFALMIVLAAMLGSMSLGVHASNSPFQATTSISFTMTTTTNYNVTTGGVLQVMFDSIQVTSPPPQAYSFGAVAKTSPGLWITRLIWQFGDGTVKDVVYCCQSQVSEVQYHAYSQPGSYTVILFALDNQGNSGSAMVTVNWVTPVPEYTSYILPFSASLLVVLFGVTSIRKRIRDL
jgi:PKD repeat protein